jgi:hypothetical protein
MGEKRSLRWRLDGEVAENDRCDGRRRTVGQLWWSPAEKKMPVRLAAHQGFLRNKEIAQRVTGNGESTKNPRGGTVHHGGVQMEMRHSRWVLVGKEMPRGTEEDALPDPAHQRGG